MTEAERIDHECEFFLMTDVAVYCCECDRIEISGKEYYPIEENERLQQLIKEKDEEINTLESQQDVMAADTVRLLDQIEYQNKAVKEYHDKISKLEFELKSAQELNRELVEVVSQLVPIAEQRLRKIVNYDMPDYYKIRSEIQSIIEHGLSLINKSI